MKKLFSAILALLLTTNIVYAASTEVSVHIPSQDELTEGKYLISVDISDNPGFASLQIELFYNENTLTCEKVVPGAVVQGMLTDFNPKAVDEKTSAILSVAGINNTTENGNLATFVFEKPKSGNPKLEFLLVEMMTADGKQVECETKITDNYGEFEEEPEDVPETDTPSNDTDDDTTSGGTTSKPTYSGGGGGSTSKPNETVIHDEAKEEPKSEEKPTITFTDVSDHWASDYIKEAVSLGIVNGMPDGTFAPDKEMTRAEFATILWNMEDMPSTDAESGFNDIKENDWYYNQIAWAYQNGYINGVSDSEFNPNGNITREQAMTILYRYAGSPETTENLEKFKDKENISSFALSAMSWAVENKIISGVSETEIAPKMSATRAQLATIIVRYLKK